MNISSKIIAYAESVSPTSVFSEDLSFHTARDNYLFGDDAAVADDSAASSSTIIVFGDQDVVKKLSLAEVQRHMTASWPAHFHITKKNGEKTTLTIPRNVLTHHAKRYYLIGMTISGSIAQQYNVDRADEVPLTAFLYWIQFHRLPVLAVASYNELPDLVSMWYFGYRIQARAFVNAVMHVIIDRVDDFDNPWMLLSTTEPDPVGTQLLDLAAYKAWYAMMQRKFEMAERIVADIPADRFKMASHKLCDYYQDLPQSPVDCGEKDHEDEFLVGQDEWDH